ncbi:leukocyte cell derived chemotaxin 2, tandem duplicate 1 [Brienomyrus brachyistius]|uniref:leukocyte cell derived chemotaxin 2, tandem duplicate 1 n=1 Tax=Brienomyrus brachyistius TaxID=42636 RepID=UPI0020B1FFFD|nr:leukocyte cell derived chemotaxin 2, tandem duplicate 1 [Brienomyrus brachyistius]
MNTLVILAALVPLVLCAKHPSRPVGVVSRSSEMVKFGTLCKGNPANKPRGCDKFGCGNYGARRDGRKRKHLGLDISCSDGDTVLTPFDVNISGLARPYKNNKNPAINDGVGLSGQGLCFKLFYVKPAKTSGMLRKGEQVGTMLPMQKVYPGIGSHVHVQMCDLSDPTKYF